MLKRSISFVIMLTLIMASFIPSALADSSLKIDGEACILVDGVSGQVLYEENSNKKWFPASITKIMTLVLALEAVENGKVSLEDQVTTSDYAASMGGSQVYLYPGETRTLNEMLIAIAVGSGNDASVAVAEFIAGSNDAFVEMMNNKAKELEMKNTHFANAHGLHDQNHYTTADDMRKLALYALSVPKFLNYTSIYEYDFRPEPKPLKLWNTNKLLKWYDGADGLKTGYTPEAKRNLVSTAERDGLRLVAVVLGVERKKGHFTESMKLLNYGFNQYEFVTIYDKKQKVADVNVGKGAVDSIDIVASKKIGTIKKKGEEIKIETQLKIPKFITAPVKAGDKVGEIIVLKDGKEFDRVKLLANNDVQRGTWGKQFGKMLRAVFMVNK